MSEPRRSRCTSLQPNLHRHVRHRITPIRVTRRPAHRPRLHVVGGARRQIIQQDPARLGEHPGILPFRRTHPRAHFIRPRIVHRRHPHHQLRAREVVNVRDRRFGQRTTCAIRFVHLEARRQNDFKIILRRGQHISRLRPQQLHQRLTRGVLGGRQLRAALGCRRHCRHKRIIVRGDGRQRHRWRGVTGVIRQLRDDRSGKVAQICIRQLSET